MKNSLKTICGLAFLAALASGCDVTDMRGTYTPSNDGVSFVQSAITATELKEGTETYSIDLARGLADDELTVNLNCEIYSSEDPDRTNNLAEAFAVPASVTFAPGEYKTSITLDVSSMELGIKYTGTISLAAGQEEYYDPNSAITSASLNLAMDYTWLEIGEGQWFDNFMLVVSEDNLNIQRCRMTQADGYNIYRLYNPWPSSEVAEAWGSDLTASNNVPEYIQFTVNDDGSIDWRNDEMAYGTYTFAALRTGYIYNAWGEEGELYYVSPTEVFGQPDNTGVVMDNILQFSYGVFSPGSDGSGWTATAYLALPAYRGNLEDLLQ